jgi:Flp pilus assembly protein TadG
MVSLSQRLFRDQRGDFAQFAFVVPILVLTSLGLINLALFGMAGVNANNAANYGARMGSVAQESPLNYAVNAANSKLDATTFGDYKVSVSAVGSGRGSLIRLSVTYSVDNYFSGLTGIFGMESRPQFQKTTVAYFRNEGW